MEVIIGIGILLFIAVCLTAGLSSSSSEPKKYINSKGYVVLTEFNELEHRYIAKQMLGRDLEENEIVHHINGNKTDNEIENLCLMDAEKHEHFHSWLRWKKEKSGKYPSISDQKRVLENEYKGTLLENLPTPLQEEIEQDSLQKKLEQNPPNPNLNKRDSSHTEKYLARRNKFSNKVFLEIDEVLISPDGKEIEPDPERFDESEEVFKSDLTERQLKVYRNLIKGREFETIEHEKRLELQKKLFNELRKVRKKLAKEKNVPAYIIFEDKTLIEMSEIMPTTESMMMQVWGMGPKKFEWYGGFFIDVVKKFKNEFKIDEDDQLKKTG